MTPRHPVIPLLPVAAGLPPPDDTDPAAQASPKVRKIPPDQRRRPYRRDPSQPWWPELIRRLRTDTPFVRAAVQFGFIALCLWIGVEFWLFVRWGASGGALPFHPRPPGAEAFLPISALMGLVQWARGAPLNTVHPAGTVILVAIVVVSLVLRKSFCSWICPIGTLGEWLARLGRRLFKRNVKVWRWLDWPLRSLKYLLLGFFVWSIAKMSLEGLAMFIEGGYNRLADIQMYLFFARPSALALTVIAVLVAAGVVIEKFWCRYLCPYGALLGLAGLVSPLRITRVKASCIDCELCSRACPSRIAVHRIGERQAGAPVGRVVSDECVSCLQCVEACPVKDTLELRARGQGRGVPAPVAAALVVGLFVAITGAGMLAGAWDNDITSVEYAQMLQRLFAPGGAGH